MARHRSRRVNFAARPPPGEPAAPRLTGAAGHRRPPPSADRQARLGRLTVAARRRTHLQSQPHRRGLVGGVPLTGRRRPTWLFQGASGPRGRPAQETSEPLRRRRWQRRPLGGRATDQAGRKKDRGGTRMRRMVRGSASRTISSPPPLPRCRTIAGCPRRPPLVIGGDGIDGLLDGDGAAGEGGGAGRQGRRGGANGRPWQRASRVTRCTPAGRPAVARESERMSSYRLAAGPVSPAVCAPVVGSAGAPRRGQRSTARSVGRRASSTPPE